MKGLPCIGGAISRDIKHSIIPYLDEVDEVASIIQSVNTVVVIDNKNEKKNKGIKLKGYNTDAIGFRNAIQNGIQQSQLNVKSAVIYGYGGVTNVVVAILHEFNIDMYLTGRNVTTIEQRAKELNINVWSPTIQVDLFVNATPATELPLTESLNLLESLSGCKMAFDHSMPGVYLEEYCKQHDIYHIKGRMTTQ